MGTNQQVRYTIANVVRRITTHGVRQEIYGYVGDSSISNGRVERGVLFCDGIRIFVMCRIIGSLL
jgi:hypothetical protein